VIVFEVYFVHGLNVHECADKSIHGLKPKLWGLS